MQVAPVPNPPALTIQAKNEFLLAAAKACLSEGLFIGPLDPYSKRPLSTILNQQGNPFSRGHNGKNGWYSASCGPARHYLDNTGTPRVTTEALKSWTDSILIGVPAPNIFISLPLSNLTVADLDTGLLNEQELIEFLNDFSIPRTRCIRSGRTTSFGAHLYYKGTTESGHFTIEWRGKVITGEIKSAGCYTVAEGSFHRSEQQYTRLWNESLTETPVALFTDILAKYKPVGNATYEVPTTVCKSDGASISQERWEQWFAENGESLEYGCYQPAKKRHLFYRTGGCPWQEQAEARGEELHTGENNPETDFVVFYGEAGYGVKCCHESCKKVWAFPNSGWQSYKALLTRKNGFITPMATRVFVGNAGGNRG